MDRDRAYIRLGYRVKTPVEKWRDPNNVYTLEELAHWDGNIGRCCGLYDIVVLDIDSPHRVDELGIKPFETRAVKTGSGGYHLYYKTTNAKKVVIHDKLGKHLGELQAIGTYVVYPPSIHPNGNTYRWINPDTPIQEITQEELLSPFRGKCKLSDELSQPRVKWVPTGITDDPLSRVSVEDAWDARVNNESNGQLFCTHPVHGSKTGSNLVINPSKGAWKCWRCGSGGGVALAIAVRYGIIQCHEARPGALRGDKFREVLHVAEEKGFIKPIQTTIINNKRRIIIDE